MSESAPIYSHNPYHATKFPLLVLDVRRQICQPFNEGFRVLHWHEEIQFVYILEGVVHFKVYAEEFDLEKGDCLFLNRAVLHHITEKQDCRYHSYLIPARMLSFFPGSAMEQDVEAFLSNPSLTHYRLQKECQEHRTVLSQLRLLDQLYFQEKNEPHKEYCLSIRLAQLWLALISLLPNSEAGSPDKGQERIRALISLIHTRYQEPISLQELAEAAHISRTECLRCFQKYVHSSPYQYLIQYRLHQSLALLLTTNLSVTEIAMQTGFGSASSYIKFFKDSYHATPHQYRLQNRSKP